MVIVAKAMRMSPIGQHFNHPAIGNPTASAFVNHARQFCLQRVQSDDAATDGSQVLSCDGIHIAA